MGQDERDARARAGWWRKLHQRVLVSGLALGAILFATAGCDNTVGPSDTELVLEIVGPQGGLVEADEVFVHLTGSGTSEHVIANPGELVTLQPSPGSYEVAAEGLVADEVESFGETTATVATGSTTSATIIVHNFVPSGVRVVPETPAPGQAVSVEWDAVTGAERYTVEWDEDQGFPSPLSVQTAQGATRHDVIFESSGTSWVRVRARSPFFNAAGRPSSALEVQVTFEGSVTVSASAEGEDVDGATVTLTGPATQRTTTTAGGMATFDELMQGTYTVSLSGIPADFVFGNTTQTTTVSASQPDPTVSFTGSIVRTASISGRVTAGGTGLEGVQVEISGGGDGITETKQTDGGGIYAHTGLRSGDYSVTISGFDEGAFDFPSTTTDVGLSTGESEIVNFSGMTRNSLENPAGIDEPVTTQAEDILFGGATVRLTLLRRLRSSGARQRHGRETSSTILLLMYRRERPGRRHRIRVRATKHGSSS